LGGWEEHLIAKLISKCKRFSFVLFPFMAMIYKLMHSVVCIGNFVNTDGLHDAFVDVVGLRARCIALVNLE
jgi:hypothetical protein